MNLYLLAALSLALALLAAAGWRLDRMADDRDAWKHRAESGEIGDAAVAAYVKKLKENHATDPHAVERALGELCQGLPRPEDAGSPARPVAADPGDRPFAHLRQDLQTCRDELDRLDAIDTWADGVGLK